MEIRLYNIGTQKVEYITHDNFNEVIRIASQMKEEDVEVQLVYTTSLIRRVDLSTFINSTKFIVAFIKTEYYSGQPDGSFTIADGIEFERLLPHLASIERLDDEDVNLTLKRILNERLSIRLISCNHIVLTNPFAIIDGLLFNKESSDMNRLYAPQNDYSEYMITHIVCLDKTTNKVFCIKNEDDLFSTIFSQDMLIEMDKESLINNNN